MQVCFYKLDGAPSGKVSFSSCNENREYSLSDCLQASNGLRQSLSVLKPGSFPLPAKPTVLSHTAAAILATLGAQGVC